MQSGRSTDIVYLSVDEAEIIRKSSSKTNPDPYFWNKPTVNKMLCLQEYCGDVINFKTYSVSYKNKKRHDNTPENMMVFKDVHEPIIERSTFEKIQLMRKTTRKKPMKSGEHSLFSGLLKCADCGRTLHYHFNQGNPNIKYFNCPGYNQGKRKVCSATHYIRVDFLEKVVLAEIRRIIKFALKHEDEFIKVVGEFSKENLKIEQEGYQSELKRLSNRDKELDSIFENLYEDNLNGKITDERFKKMSLSYEIKQKDISEKMIKLRHKLEKIERKSLATEDFIASVKKFARTKKVTAGMLNELIEYIEVHHAERIDGVKTQKLVIHYNFTGVIEIPEDASIDTPEVQVQTRRGVSVNYQPA